jgi:hypothetical protein
MYVLTVIFERVVSSLPFTNCDPRPVRSSCTFLSPLAIQGVPWLESWAVEETLPSLADSGSGEPRIATVLEVILPVTILS